MAAIVAASGHESGVAAADEQSEAGAAADVPGHGRRESWKTWAVSAASASVLDATRWRSSRAGPCWPSARAMRASPMPSRIVSTMMATISAMPSSCRSRRVMAS
ncbi:MAG: hypothetical protein E6G10_23190 [Actinobacteria bacterium]|nr:MAG: hypothetical protein E6G10_23190 [Actinomycetota bacterium]